MKKILSFFAAALLSCSAMAEHHHEAEVAAASEVFNSAYETNDADTYFDFYTEDAVVFFYGERQSVAAYREEWTASIKAGGGVELNKRSDLRVQMMPSGDAAVLSSFIDNRTRAVDGGLTTVKGDETEIWQKIAGKWRVVGLHYSEFVPAK